MFWSRTSILRPHRGLWLLVAAVAVCLPLAGHSGAGDEAPAADSITLLTLVQPGADSDGLHQYASRHYTIHTDLSLVEAQPFGQHMDQVFGEYERRFAAAGFGPREHQAMPLYLFRNRDGYFTFMRRHRIEATNTDGLFFRRSWMQGLATWVEGRSRTQVFAVLQHEGFHQFAYAYVGSNLPVWANEGLAQYFEDGIVVRDRMVLSQASGQRVQSIQQAVRNRQVIEFEQMLRISSDDWHHKVCTDGKTAGLLYDQAWSMVYYLLTADNGRYRPAFERYLVLLSQDRPATAAFREAFADFDAKSFQRQWEQFALELTPDPMATTIARMEFLGQALRHLHERAEAPVRSIDQLRQRLQAMQFRAVRRDRGMTVQLSALDEANYTFPTSVASDAGQPFQIVESADKGLPPCVTAIGLSPRPTLSWTRTTDGRLVPDLQFE